MIAYITKIEQIRESVKTKEYTRVFFKELNTNKNYILDVCNLTSDTIRTHLEVLSVFSGLTLWINQYTNKVHISGRSYATYEGNLKDYLNKERLINSKKGIQF